MQATNLYKDYAIRLGTNVKEHSVKMPMLIVGANAYTRTIVKWNAIQEYDIHWLFEPRSESIYSLGCVLLSRVIANQKPVILSEDNKSIQDCFSNLAKSIDVTIRDLVCIDNLTHPETIHPKLIAWWVHYIYRCPKISLKDVLHLETYKEIT
jgi:hypothetical protein